MLGKVKFQFFFFELQYADISFKSLYKNRKKTESYLSEIITHKVTQVTYVTWCGKKYFAAGIFLKRNLYEQIMVQ